MSYKPLCTINGTLDYISGSIMLNNYVLSSFGISCFSYSYIMFE